MIYQILITILERTCDDIRNIIQQRKCHVEVTSEGLTHARPIVLAYHTIIIFVSAWIIESGFIIHDFDNNHSTWRVHTLRSFL